ncbi:MAG: aspartate--tRNA ligase [Micavibrio sp.]
MHSFRTHTCGQLGKSNVGDTVRLSGWVHRKRDHGGVLFVDLRDTYGITQLVAEGNEELERVRLESVITIEGEVVNRAEGTVNPKMATGEIEVAAKTVFIHSMADIIPFQVAENDGAGEDIRLKYRYLDLRREGMHSRVRLRNNVIAAMRRRMWDEGFQEFNTPILTASSPEGARDYLVPSRLHPGKVYALPQAPQQFKQLLMMSGFDRYFQIAPCFRDEDGRADRLAEFYQLDMEMSFVEQEDIFKIMTQVIGGIFEEFSDFTNEKRRVEWLPNMPYREAMEKYGSDKPDLRNPLVICDVTDVFKRDDVTFNAFKGVIEKGGRVKAIRAPKVADRPRSFFDKLNDWARGEGAVGLGYITLKDGAGAGPIAKFVPAEAQAELNKAAGLEEGDAVFFICDKEDKALKFAGRARDKICDDMDIREKGVFKLFWLVDFPMYERDEKTGKIDFSHNPFSQPRGGMEALNGDPLAVIANQYDCVCNGFELCSGGIRNHSPEIMEKAFALAGYDRGVMEKKFGGMLNAFRYGAPPHGGCAFGVDRIVMLLADEPNLREVYAFVMNGQYEDPMMNAPSEITEQQLKDLHLKLNLPKKVEAA